ncbi:MAG TPA: thioredoxin domain-containing protein, partial [Herpetosiphonaceae bacterium]|nr:thioredoxin domain-containing protein [Herpetosiphonaceae bacterium]
ETRWLDAAVRMAEALTELFWDEERRTFFDTAADHEQLVTRPRDIYDNATPSGTSVAVDVLLRLSLLLERPEFGQFAQAVLEDLSGGMARLPGAFGRLISAADFALAEPREIAVVGPPDSPATRALLAEIYRPYLPNKVVAGRDPGDEAAAAAIPLLRDRPARDGAPTAYVCVRHTCQNPTADPAELARQLEL